MLSLPESALLWVARLDEALRGDPLLPAWRQRAMVREAARAAASDGLMVDMVRLGGLLAGLPLRHLADFGAERHALEVLVGLRNLAANTPNDRVRAALSRMKAEHKPGRNLLEAAARGMLAHLADGGAREDARLALPLYLLDTGVVRSGPLPCLTGSGAFRAEGSPRDLAAGFHEALCRDLAGEARNGLDDLIDLRRAWRSWRRRLGPRRSTSQLPALVDYAAACQAVTPAQVAQHFDLSLRGAGKLLAELAELGILVDASGRETWKVYVTEDLKSVREEVERVQPARAGDPTPSPKPGKPPPPRPAALEADPLELADDLSGLLADTERALARIQRRLDAPPLPFRLEPED